MKKISLEEKNHVIELFNSGMLMKDIAAQCNLSAKTVSTIINNSEKVHVSLKEFNKLKKKNEQLENKMIKLEHTIYSLMNIIANFEDQINIFTIGNSIPSLNMLKTEGDLLQIATNSIKSTEFVNRIIRKDRIHF